MPIVISTRAKAIAKQKREAASGRRISYAKIWIQEFQRVFPNCPYTANNLSVHYWYWTSRQPGQDRGDKGETAGTPKKATVSMEVEEADTTADWTNEHFEDLRRIGEKVKKIIKEDGSDKQKQFSKLLHSVWLNLYSGSTETEKSLLSIYNRTFRASEAESPAAEVSVAGPAPVRRDRWTPRHNKVLREIVSRLTRDRSYTRSNVAREWRQTFPRVSWDILAARIDDCGLAQPPHIVHVKDKPAAASKTPGASKSEAKAPEVLEPTPAGLNARGQMRWTQQAVTDLLDCHKLGLKAKNVQQDRRLADLVHEQFLQRHPYCPIAPNVLLTKCYILRSELKSGKLVLNDETEDTGEKYRGDAGLRTWTREMLEELTASRKRAIGRKKSSGGGANQGKLLGDLWLEEFRAVYPDYRSSKKNLFRKYKWWRQRRAETEREGGRAAARVSLEQEPVLVAELRRSLSENTVTLPPFVSSKVIMLAQHWVENTADTSDTGDTLNTADTPGDGDTDTGAGRGMITLPGGAVLVAKTGQLEADKTERGAEPPDVSITLSSQGQGAHTEVSIAPSSAQTGAEVSQGGQGVPSSLLTILDTMGLPLALLPTLLAVYRDVRDTYKVRTEQWVATVAAN